MQGYLFDFMGYMLFSSLEYLGLFLLIFSVFTCYPEYHKKEIAYLTIGFTSLSYVLVITNLFKIIPIPIFIVALLPFIFRRLFNDKYTYCLVITIAGIFFYGFLQSALIKISVFYGMVEYSDTSNAFATKAYVFQTLCSFVSISISLYMRHYNNGFGFSFRKVNNLFFVLTSIFLFVAFSSVYLVSLYNQTANIFIIAVAVLISSTFCIIYLSHKQDSIEFS